MKKNKYLIVLFVVMLVTVLVLIADGTKLINKNENNHIDVPLAGPGVPRSNGEKVASFASGLIKAFNHQQNNASTDEEGTPSRVYFAFSTNNTQFGYSGKGHWIKSIDKYENDPETGSVNTISELIPSSCAITFNASSFVDYVYTKALCLDICTNITSIWGRILVLFIL